MPHKTCILGAPNTTPGAEATGDGADLSILQVAEPANQAQRWLPGVAWKL